MVNLQQQVIFVYDHFYPDFTAGGPVTSLNNLGNLIRDKVPVKILASAYHYKEKKILTGIKYDQWTNWKELPVWYATTRSAVRKALSQSDLPQKSLVIYLNGIFSPRYFLFPLWISVRKGYKIIISPRGMLQAGALKKGSVKKKLLINLLKISGALKKVTWHATDEQEERDIRNIIGSESMIYRISNVPQATEKNQTAIVKEKGVLKLFYYSLISEKKNLLFLLKLLQRPELKNITLDIIGPVKDDDYWRKCMIQIETLMPGRVTYHGEINPESRTKFISGFHVMALPTLGENYGHAIVETLSSSMPVVISDQTPWKDLEQNNAGFALALNEEAWVDALVKMLNWNATDYSNACFSAFDYYKHKFDFGQLKQNYIDMFNS